MLRKFFWSIEDFSWGLKCIYNLWLHGPYGLAKTIEKMPFKFLVKYLRKYGANIGQNCRFERGLNIHRPFGKKPFENLVIGNNVYLGHNTLIDLSEKVTIGNGVIIASRCQIWTHASYYDTSDSLNPEYHEHKGSVTIGDCSIIYSNVLVVHGVRIGKLARIGANSLVNRNVRDEVFVGGSPTRELL